MRRRTILALAAGAIPPLPSRAQGSPPIVGVLRSNPRSSEQFQVPFARDMARLGWVEGKSYATEYRWADGDGSRLRALAVELAAINCKVIIAFGNPAVEALQAATHTIPIVGMANDLAGSGLVASMARPGGNTTGVSIMSHQLDGKRLEFLHDLVPQARRIAVVIDPGTTSKGGLETLQKVASGHNLELVFVNVRRPEQIGGIFEQLATAKVDAVLIMASAFLNAHRALFVERLRALKLPAMHEWPETVEEGGLASYGARIGLLYRHVAVLVDKVLRGTKPADLPIEQPTTFALAINAKAARELDLPIPPVILLRAETVVD